jgi:hypothetical protein
MVLLHGRKMAALDVLWSTIVRIESNLWLLGRSVMRSIAIWEKGQGGIWHYNLVLRDYSSMHQIFVLLADIRSNVGPPVFGSYLSDGFVSSRMACSGMIVIFLKDVSLLFWL